MLIIRVKLTLALARAFREAGRPAAPNLHAPFVIKLFYERDDLNLGRAGTYFQIYGRHMMVIGVITAPVLRWRSASYVICTLRVRFRDHSLRYALLLLRFAVMFAKTLEFRLPIILR